jgi:hypothetical protein
MISSISQFPEINTVQGIGNGTPLEELLYRS